MRIASVITALVATAGLSTACFVDQPQTVEYYNMQIDSELTELVINSRPNMDAQVKRILGVSETGVQYVVDICFGVSTGQAVNPVANEDIMVCVGEASDPLGFNITQVGCYDGRSPEQATITPTVDVELVSLGSGMEGLEGDLSVDLMTPTGPMDLTTDFRVRASTASAVENTPEPVTAQPVPWID